MWRDLAICLSLANLCYIRVWSELLTYTEADTFLMKSPPSPVHYVAAMLNTLLLGGLLWAGITLARRERTGWPLKLARWGFFLLLLVPLNGLRAVLANVMPDLRLPGLLRLAGPVGVVLMSAVIVTPTLLAVIRLPRQSARFVSTLLLILSPFVGLTLARAVVAARGYAPSPYADKSLAPPLITTGAEPSRVVWVIFDEWDQRLTFSDRDPTLRLPEIDRFFGEAVRASSAYPPGEHTSVSIPSLTTGRVVANAKPRGPDELWLTYAGEPHPVTWSGQPNIFSVARALGWNTAVVGWYVPYCRVVNTSLSSCQWWEMGLHYNVMGKGLGEVLANQARSLFETNARSVFGQSLSTLQHMQTYRAFLDRAKEVATNPDLRFILLHFPVPHAPHFYDRMSGKHTLKNSPLSGYLGALELTDRTLGELRRAMENADVWETATIVLSSDHSFRSADLLDGKLDRRVPFLIKMSGQKEGITYDSPMNTVLTHDLLLAVLRGEVGSARDVVAWLDKHRSRDLNEYADAAEVIGRETM